MRQKLALDMRGNCATSGTAGGRYKRADSLIVGQRRDGRPIHNNAATWILAPETEPEAIAADQRAAIAEVLATRPRATPEELSELVILPVWVVRRRLEEIRELKRRKRRA